MLLGIAGTFGLARWNEHKANRLFAEANQLVQKGQDAEETSYGKAFEHYKAALDNAKAIPRDYPSTSPAARLLQDPTLGTYTLKELQETIVPEMHKKAEMEGDPLAVARFLLNKINVNKDVEALGFRHHYAEAGRYDEAIELIETISTASLKEAALAEAHAKSGNFDQAKQIAESIQDPFDRCGAANVLAERLAKEHLPDQAKEILDQAKQVTDATANTYQKSSLQSCFEAAYFPVAIAYIDIGQYQQAEDIAATISRSQKSPYILERIVDKYAESQQFDKAREFAEGIQDSSAKASAFANIAKRYAEAGRFDDAMRIVDALGDSYFKDESLTGISAAHAQAGHYDLAIQVATSIQGAGKASAFTKIATDSMKAGELPPTLLPTVNRIEDPFQKSAALGDIGYELAKTGRVDEGLQIVRTIGGPEGRANHLYRIARLYSDAKKFDEAVGILGEVEGLE